MARHFTSLEDPAVAELLRKGAVGVIPTDTVYGLVASAVHPSAIAKLYATKPRELPPGTMIGASMTDFRLLGFPAEPLEKAQSLWPAPLSIVCDATSVAPFIKQGRTELPVRIPQPPALAALLQQTGPLMTTSANAPKQPTSTTVKMAYAYFGEMIDFYVDGGDLSGRPASTIATISSNGDVTIHRQGAAKIPKHL